MPGTLTKVLGKLHRHLLLHKMMTLAIYFSFLPMFFLFCSYIRLVLFKLFFSLNVFYNLL